MPLTKSSNKLLDYTNCIIYSMQKYIRDKILENNLSWDKRSNYYLEENFEDA